MANKEGIREYFSRHLLGRLKVFSLPLDGREVNVMSHKREVEVRGHAARERIVSSRKFIIEKIICASSVINVKNFESSVKGGKVAKYASGEINVKKIKLKFAARPQKWTKEFLSLPQERHNRLKFLAEKNRKNAPGELNLAYFYPIIEDNIVKLVLNKQDGTLFIWYNPNARSFVPKGLYMVKHMGEKEIGWKWGAM